MARAARKAAARGFTLIELVIVIAVIAILAALLVPTILGQADRARVSRARSEVANLAKAFARMRTDTGATVAANATCFTIANLVSATLPSGCPTGLAACSPSVPGQVCWGGPYLSSRPSGGSTADSDPWNQAYVVLPDSASGSVKVASYGPNKTNDSCAANTDDVCVAQ